MRVIFYVTKSFRYTSITNNNVLYTLTYTTKTLPYATSIISTVIPAATVHYGGFPLHF